MRDTAAVFSGPASIYGFFDYICMNKLTREKDDPDDIYGYHHDYHRLSARLDSERRVDRQEYYGIDIREHGSKNAGTTNMLRVLGRRAALPVFALDFLKGFVAVTIIELMQYDDLIGQNDLINLKIVAVFAAVLGHIFPIFAGFRGGKGVATLVGAVTGIYPPVALLCFGVWLVMLMVSHYVSLASMVAGCCFPVFTLISPKVNGSTAFVVFSFVIAILLIYTHRKNIERLKAGTESKTFIWKPRRVKLDAEEQKKRDKEHDTK